MSDDEYVRFLIMTLFERVFNVLAMPSVSVLDLFSFSLASFVGLRVFRLLCRLRKVQ